MLRSFTLADQVYEHLLRRISSGELPAGSPLKELDLVARLGVSRTPIREALARLAEYGLVEVLGNRSTRVRRLGRDEVGNIYQVRTALEGLGVELACGRLTAADFARLDGLQPAGADDTAPGYEDACYQFDLGLHRLVGERSGNPILAAEVRKLHDLIQLVHRPVADRKGRLAAELRQHRAIVAALRAGDAARAGAAMREHLEAACATLVRFILGGEAPPASPPPAAPADAAARAAPAARAGAES